MFPIFSGYLQIENCQTSISRFASHWSVSFFWVTTINPALAMLQFERDEPSSKPLEIRNEIFVKR